MRRVVTGEEIAQLHNPDPFAVPAWRSGGLMAGRLAASTCWPPLFSPQP